MNDLANMVLPIWIVLAGAALIAIGFAIRAERRWFAARGKAGPWLWLRVSTIPIGILTVLAIILPARIIGGEMALAAFYLLMFSAGPLVYFGLHRMVGSLLRPQLTSQEITRVGLSGLMMSVGPAMLAQILQPWVFQVASTVQQTRFALADESPLLHRIMDQRRFILPDIGEVWTEHWQAPPGVSIDHIELEVGGQYLRTGDSSGSLMCRSGEDIHVFWPAWTPPPHWRIYWQTAEGGLVRSDRVSVPTDKPPIPFTLNWHPDGFELPVRVPRGLASMTRQWPEGRQQVDSMDTLLQPGDSFVDNCLPLEYRRTNAAKEPPITAFSIRLWHRDKQQLLAATMRRPTE